MIKIGIIEDTKLESDLLREYILRFCNEKKVEVSIDCFNSKQSFLSNFNSTFDILFVDIELGDGNGMDLVKLIREKDKKVLIIFVTNMAQYAVKGYEVRAFDFIVKPVVYENFSVKLSSALHCLKQKKDVSLCISNKDGKIYINSSTIKYIEVVQHMLIYHLVDGSNITASGSLSMIEKDLSGTTFALCNRCYLVNLKYVTAIRGFDLFLGNEKIYISRSKKTSFIKEVNDFLAEGDM